MTNQSHKTYNKLVRDRIPEIIAAEGRQYATETMADAEYRHALLVKLVEESQEIAEADGEDLLKELADLYEVLDAVIAAFSLREDTVRAVQQQRRKERGGFNKRIKLLWTG